MDKISEAIQLLADIGMPRAQLNERTALCLLALANIQPNNRWSDAQSPLIGITPIMDWAREIYKKEYAPNTRETFRRQSMHQFVEAGVALYNPDDPFRPVNSPKAVYQISPGTLALIKSFGSISYTSLLQSYLFNQKTLAQKYAREREMNMLPLNLGDTTINLSAGEHSQLIIDIIHEFAPRFVPNSELVYVGDTGDKHGYFNIELLNSLGVFLDNHGKLPDVILYDRNRNWLVLVESVTSHGPVDGKRYYELKRLFSTCTAGLVFVSAFPNNRTFARFSPEIAWETEVWIKDAPTHMIHFNGVRFLGPY